MKAYREHSGAAAARGARAALAAGLDPHEGARAAVLELMPASNPLGSLVADWFARDVVPVVVARAQRLT